MSKQKTGYSTYDHDNLEAADSMKIERKIYFESETADISALTALPLAELMKLREESAVAEQAIFAALQEQAAAWEEQAGKTVFLQKAIEYARTPEAQHTANQWQAAEHGGHTISNRVYQMRYYVYENTRYDREKKEGVPYSYSLSWSIYTNSPSRDGQGKIAGQDRKVFADKAAMEKYLAGRIKAYQHLFTELSPPVPPEFAGHFKVNGQLLPGYTIAGEERTEPEQAAPQPEAPAAKQPDQPRPVVPIIPTAWKSDEKLKEITDRLEQGITELFDSDRYTDYLRVMSKFPQYSLRNTILIAMQAPDASHVMSFNAWKAPEIDRHVKANEKGIRILAPAPITVKKQVKKLDPDTRQPIIGADGKPVTEEQEVKIPNYKVVCVYDVAQTEGKELPALADELTGDVAQYQDFFKALEKTSPFPMEFQTLQGGAKGRCDYDEQRIFLHTGMSELQTLKTAIHEIAHAKLHDIDEQQPRPDRRTREVEAESVAYTVCQHYGLDTSDYSFGYVAGWSSGRELSELKGSLETIRTAAAKIINSIDKEIAELQKAQDKEQVTPAQEKAPQEPTAEQEKDGSEMLPPEQPEAAAPQQEAAAPEAAVPPQAEKVPEAAPPETPPLKTAAPYYTINETAARRAKEANSFYDYKPGSATAEYRSYVDKAVQIAEQQKKRVDPMYHEKIDSLLDTYARKLAENMNKGYEIAGRVPSILIAGGSNFPVRKKEKQNAAADRNMEEYREIQGLLDKIRSTGMGGISADDPQAVQKLESKLAGLEKSQETMKAVNAYYRQHKTLDGCPHLSPEGIERLKSSMASSYHVENKPYPTWALSNNSAEIRRVKERIQSLTRQKEVGFVGWEFEGGKVEANTADNRLQILFDEKPDEATREELKSSGFRWSPRAGAWQRQLTANAYYAADSIKAIAPLTGKKPSDLQRAHTRQQTAPAQEAPQPEAAADKDTFSIYQLKGGEETRYLRFEPYDRLQAAGNVVDRANYELVYTAPLTPGTSLEDIFTRFNIDHPKDFTGHSLSLSDVVVLHQDGQDAAHYVDSFGYKEVPEFLQEQKQLTPDELETGETIRTPRGTFYITAMSVEQMEAAGYGLHHTSDDGKYLIMGNGTRAFAVAAQPPENHLQTAEQTTEQNYNMIDGVINNTPTDRELEARVTEGEQLSLTDLMGAAQPDKARAPKREEKPSIRAQLKADKERTAQKKAAKQKKHDLEV